MTTWEKEEHVAQWVSPLTFSCLLTGLKDTPFIIILTIS